MNIRYQMLTYVQFTVNSQFFRTPQHNHLSNMISGLCSKNLGSLGKNNINSLLGLQTISKRFKHEYAPRFKEQHKKQKGRVPVRTGGSTKGSTLEFGTYGLRLKSEGVRLTAQQLKEADNALMRYVRPLTNGQLFRRLCTNIAVCIKGNETRMGKGKGAFDHWMVRVPTGKIIFEMKGDNLHERVAREAFRKAGSKLPGIYEFVSPQSPIRVGLHKFVRGENDEKPNYWQKLDKKPTKEHLAMVKSKEPQFRLFRGR